MDPVSIGAVLLAIAGGAGSQLGSQLWEGVVSLVCRPFNRKATSSSESTLAEVVPVGRSELAAFEQSPGDQHKAIALAEVLLTRSGAEDEFRRALETWWQQAGPIRASIGSVTNKISGGTQQGPVLMGRDFSNVSFGEALTRPPAPPS